MFDVFERWSFPEQYSINKQAGIWASVLGNPSASHPPQGWKLHVSARPDTLAATVDEVMGILLNTKCDFKVIRTPDLLRDLNAGLFGPGSVGKAMTIYPRQEEIVHIAYQLAAALKGFDGPRISSDRRVHWDAPVYYRFGPVAPRLRMNDDGGVELALEAPDGVLESGQAGTSYLQPTWAEDPFKENDSPAASLPQIDGAPVIGDHFKILGTIAQTHRGTSFRAIDLRSGTRVIIKEAKAFVNENREGDARVYLRNERRILEALEGVFGVPRMIDHFSYGPDEFLVSTDLGASNLIENIVEFGHFTASPGEQRCAIGFARNLLHVLDSVHERGVIYRDLAPKNIISLAEGGWGLVDFELSRYAGVQRFGWSPGYSHDRQRRNEPATVYDDYFALGMTIFHAMTGLDPVMVDPNPETNLVRTLVSLDAVVGKHGVPAARIVKQLVDSDPEIQNQGILELRNSSRRKSRTRRLGRHATPKLDRIYKHTLNTVLEQAHNIAEQGVRRNGLPPPIAPFGGLAGIVMELVQHSDGLQLAKSLSDIIAYVAGRVDSPPALLYGRMGIAIALQEVAGACSDEKLELAALSVVPEEVDVRGERRVDVTHGLAGIGIGFLSLAATESHSNRYLHLADECAKRLLDEDAEGQLSSLPVGNPTHGISVADGFAHGRAGIAYFLLGHGAITDNPTSLETSLTLMLHLADLVSDLERKTNSPLARPMSASWCQGLAGIGMTLVHGARFFDDHRLLEAAECAARGCLAVAPRVPLVTQCCGLAGIGEFLLDLSITSGVSGYRENALQVLNLMLMRSGGSLSAPCFPDTSLARTGVDWATGTSGVLSFLRRLETPSTPRLWTIDFARFQSSPMIID